jgi:hypothetical protein
MTFDVDGLVVIFVQTNIGRVDNVVVFHRLTHGLH